MAAIEECAGLLEALSEPVLLASPDGRVLACNSAVENRLATARAALLRRPLGQLFSGLPEPLGPHVGRAPFRVHFSLAHGPSPSFRLRLRRTDDLLIATLEEHDQARKALASLRRELTQTERLARIGRVSWEPAPGRIDWSPELARIIGISAAARASYPAFIARVHADDREPLLHVIARSRRGRKSFFLRHRVVRPNGQVRQVQSRGRWTLTDTGERLTLLLQDVTPLVQTERAMARLARRNELLLDSVGEGIIGIDRDGRCTFVNPAALAMLGYSREELMAAPSVHLLIHHSRPDGSPYPLEECPMWRAVHAGEGTVLSRAELLFARGGQSFPATYSAHPIVEDAEVRGAVIAFRDVAESHALMLKMDFLATHDPLTGLVNRYQFEQCLGDALVRSRERNTGHVLCYIDLDQFKIVNDTCGHVAGDELLRQLSALFKAQLRPQDVIARLGGDEFGVLFEETSLADARPLIEALHRAAHGFRFQWQQKRFSVGLSIGVVQAGPQSESAAAVLSAADTACYVAKQGGRDRIHVHRDNDTDLLRHRGEMLWVGKLEEALAQNRFDLRYQPIVPLHPDASGGEYYEILLSLRDASGLSVPPGQFVPAAERFNLMPAIDRWVVRQVLEWLAAHPAQLERLGLCTINLSGNSLGDPATLDFIVRQLEHSRVPPDRIGFEITETAAIANLTHALGFMHRLSAIGCRFALDDFGSGMSSFGYLKQLPVDFLKIDGAFVRDIAHDRVDRAMVKAINHVGQVMNIRTIAEHLESGEVLAVLREIGVDFVQGFGTGAPRDLAAML